MAHQHLYLATCVAAAPAEGGGARGGAQARRWRTVENAPVRAALTASSIALHGTGREAVNGQGRQ